MSSCSRKSKVNMSKRCNTKYSRLGGGKVTKEEFIEALEDLQKRVEKIEKETIHILNRIEFFLFLWCVIHSLIMVIY